MLCQVARWVPGADRTRGVVGAPHCRSPDAELMPAPGLPWSAPLHFFALTLDSQTHRKRQNCMRRLRLTKVRGSVHELCTLVDRRGTGMMRALSGELLSAVLVRIGRQGASPGGRLHDRKTGLRASQVVEVGSESQNRLGPRACVLFQMCFLDAYV